MESQRCYYPSSMKHWLTHIPKNHLTITHQLFPNMLRLKQGNTRVMESARKIVKCTVIITSPPVFSLCCQSTHLPNSSCNISSEVFFRFLLNSHKSRNLYFPPKMVRKSEREKCSRMVSRMLPAETAKLQTTLSKRRVCKPL